MGMGSLKRIAALSLLATVAVLVGGGLSVHALTVPGTQVNAPTPVSVQTPVVRVPSTAPVNPPATPKPVAAPKPAPVVKQVTRPVTNVVNKTVPKTTGTVNKVVPKTTNTVKKTVPQTNTVKKTAPKTVGTVNKAVPKSGSSGSATGTVRDGVQTIAGTVTGGGGGSAGGGGSGDGPAGPAGPVVDAVTRALGGTQGPTGGGPAGGATYSSAAGPGGPAASFPSGSLAAMLSGAGPRRLRSVLEQLDGCLPALPAVDRRVISMRAGLHGAPLTRAEVGAQLGLSNQAVRRTERRALNRLQFAAANTGCAANVVGPFDGAGIGNLTPQLISAGAVPVASADGSPVGSFNQTRGIFSREASPLFELGGGGGGGPAWAIILFTVLFSVSVAGLTRELRGSF